MSVTLYALHLSRHVQGMAKGPAPESPHVQNTPDSGHVAQCLPHFYRAAFDRAMIRPWSRLTKGNLCLSLHTSRGRYLNTVYAIPYQFNASKES